MKEALLSKKVGKAEYITMFLYVILLCIVECFHESWFDEVQAWQIARSASLKEILLEVPHYEGHPQLWHLLLYPFAKLNLPFKIPLFLVNLAFCGSAVGILLFRSPFPKVIRCTLPFNFFFFYMYGVHNRPYCIVMLAFCLLALNYEKRNEKPANYVLTMILLCFSTAYGVTFAGGLCMVWVWEILQEYQKNGNYANIPKDKRAWWLFGILLCAIFIFLCIIPAKDCVYGGVDMDLSTRLMRLVFFFLILFESTFGAYISDGSNAELTFGLEMVLSCFGGLIIFLILAPILKKNKMLLTGFVPYIVFVLFAAFVHFGSHHLGIVLMFWVFIFWIICERGFEVPEIFETIKGKIDSQMTLYLLKGVAGVCILIPVVYCGSSVYLDIQCRIGPLEVYNFIRENQLENRTFMFIWDFEVEADEDSTDIEKILLDETLPIENFGNFKTQDPIMQGDPATLSGYFLEDTTSMFPYFNTDAPQKRYMQWRQQTPEEIEETYQKWREIGLPDFVVGPVPIQKVFTEEQLQGVTYYWVETCRYGFVWKFDAHKLVDHVYIRGDLLEEYPQFEVITYRTYEPEF